MTPFALLEALRGKTNLRLTRLEVVCRAKDLKISQVINNIIKSAVMSFSRDFSIILVTKENASQSSKLACGKKFLRC